jgi:ferredoxin
MNRRRFMIYVVLIPVLTLAGAFIGHRSHVFLSRVHEDVYLAELMIRRPELRNDTENLDIQAFLQSGETFEQLVEEAEMVRTQFKKGGTLLGGFLGLVLGITLMNQVVFRRKENYEPDRVDCVSCGRCMDFCPVDRDQPSVASRWLPWGNRRSPAGSPSSDHPRQIKENSEPTIDE